MLAALFWSVLDVLECTTEDDIELRLDADESLASVIRLDLDGGKVIFHAGDVPPERLYTFLQDCDGSLGAHPPCNEPPWDRCADADQYW